jgi:hypothetical protein
VPSRGFHLTSNVPYLTFHWLCLLDLQAAGRNYGIGDLPPLGGGFSFSSSPQNDKTVCTDPR